MQPEQPKLCECGCGRHAPIATETSRRDGWVKGQPKRFVSGHNTRGSKASEQKRERTRAAKVGARNPSWRGDDVGYNAIHSWLRRHHPKTGVCEECGKIGRTEYAFKRHPEPHTRDRADYRELCSSCHLRFDYSIGHRRPSRS